VKLDTASHVLWILNLFRDMSRGKRINHDLASIRETAENCMSGGVWVGQMDPLAMLKIVASCGLDWDNYFSTVLSKPSGGSGPNSGGGSGSGQFTHYRPSKRPFTAANQAVGRTADRQPVGGGAAKQPFDPFITIPNMCHVDKSDVNKRWFVRGQSNDMMTSLMREGKCVLCKQAGLMMVACPS
jgi:hypothetical protein